MVAVEVQVDMEMELELRLEVQQALLHLQVEQISLEMVVQD